ncbi:flavodoxin family protein [Candidatus Bathyarchaeota archaeon]|nr:flavodoxin family protein [Candidatus Bathyarchaeota archaeon]
MKSKAKLLAIIGSHRKNANSYLLTKNVLDSTKMDYEIIQLAEKRIDFCDLCEKCIDEDCVLTDDFNQIFEKMKRADGIILALPKYLFFSSRFLSFLERLATIEHMRKFMGYVGALKNPDYKLFQRNKPFCIFFVSGTGRIGGQILSEVVDDLKGLGFKLVRHSSPPNLEQ